MRFVGVCTPWSHFTTKTKHGLQRWFDVFPGEFGLQNHRAHSPCTKVDGIEDRLEKYFSSSKIWWSKFGENKLTKMRKSIVLSNVNYFGKSCILIQKYSISSSITSKWAITLILYHFEVLMRATQPPNMKVKLHLEVVEPDFIFFWVAVEFVWCFHYKGRSDRFPSFCQFVFPKFRPSDLRAEKIFFQTVFCTSKLNPKTH